MELYNIIVQMNRTSLMLAAERGRLEMVALLLERQADVDVQHSVVRVQFELFDIGLVNEPL